MKAMLRISVCCSMLFAIGCARRVNGPTSRAAAIDEKQLLIDAIADESQFGSISVDNSVVVIHTDGVDRVIEQGPAIIPTVLEKMRTPGIDFDTFVRCCSAAEQIAEKQGLQDRIHWYGGAGTADFMEKSQKLGPGWQTFDDAFRKEVIDSIEKCFSEKIHAP